MNRAHSAHLTFASAVFASLVLLATASTATAQDSKIISGFACVEISSKGTWKSKKMTNNGERVATNVSTVQGESIDVVCPLPRENTSSTTGLKSLTVYYIQPHSAVVWCQPYSLDLKGKVVKAIDPNVRTSPHDLPQPLPWLFDTTFSMNSSVPDGTYFVMCTVGMGTSIHSIRYEEY